MFVLFCISIFDECFLIDAMNDDW